VLKIRNNSSPHGYAKDNINKFTDC